MNIHHTKKIIIEIEKVKEVTKALRDNLGLKIVVTIGSWDMLHIGHLRYLNKAASYGDILIVGTDTDRAIKLYKNPLRPVIPEEERLEMLSYQSCVGIITRVDDVNENGEWQYGLIKAVRPDVFVAVENSYPPQQQEDIKQYCSELVVLPRQAQNTSTSHKIQDIVKKTMLNLVSKI